MIAKHAVHYGSEWDRYLCYLLFAYRVKPHDSTGESPFFLLYRRYARLPTETALSIPRTPYQVDTQDYRTSLMEGLTTAWKNARLKINSAQQRYKTQYDKRSKTCQYQVGDRVFICMPIEQQGNLRKLARPFFRPYRIEAVTPSTIWAVPGADLSLSIWIVYDHVTERYLTLRGLEKKKRTWKRKLDHHVTCGQHPEKQCGHQWKVQNQTSHYNLHSRSARGRAFPEGREL